MGTDGNQTNYAKVSGSVFLAYARDAGNWSGTPWLDGNVHLTKESRGNLTQLKRAGLLKTVRDPEYGEYIRFTDTGKSLARQYGINTEDWD